MWFAVLVQFALFNLFWPQAAEAGKAHRHGVVVATLAQADSEIALDLEVPLDSLVGFERAPRTDAERQAVAQALAIFRKPDALFQFDTAAGCTTDALSIDAPVWQAALQSPASQNPTAPASIASRSIASAPPEHAELTASYRIRCTGAEKAKQITWTAFDTFRRIERIEGQLALSKGQLRRLQANRSSRVVRLNP